MAHQTTKGLRDCARLSGSALVVLGLLVCARPAQAFNDCERDLRRLRRFEVQQAASTKPEAVRSSEIMGPPPKIGHRVAGVKGRAPARHINPSLTRRLNGLWRMRIPRSVSPAALIVTHRLSGANEGAVTEQDGNLTLAVQIRPLRPVVVCRNATDQIVEGSAELHLSLRRLPLAGRYRGTIETDVRVP